MNNDTATLTDTEQWFAIRTRQAFKAEEALAAECSEVYFPKESVKGSDGRTRVRAIIPRVLFIRTTQEHALAMERQGREEPGQSVPSFWIYRNPGSQLVQQVPERTMELLRLLTAPDPTRCTIYGKEDFRTGNRVRVTGGPFRGYEGHVQRVKKNKHVVVRIEGICTVLLPFIHPDLLETMN